MGKNPIAWVLPTFLSIYLILALLPWWHETLITLSKDSDPLSRFLFLFTFDPLEYVWKWIVGLIIALLVPLASNK